MTSVVKKQESFSAYPFTSNFHPEFTVGQLRAALRQHEQGMFRGSADIAEALGRDPAYSGFIDSRIRTALSASRRLVPATHERTELAAYVAQQAEAIVETWHEMSNAAPMLRSSIGLGFALAQTVWAEDGTPTPEYWDPATVSVQWSPTNGPGWYTQTVEIPLLELYECDPRWFLFVPGGRRRGWMDAAVRSVAETWLGAKYARRDWLQYSERHGLPIIKGYMPANTNFSDDKAQFISDIDSISGRTSVALPQGLNPGDSYNLEILEATANTWQTFKAQIDDANSLIAKRILGTDSEAQPGGLGSGAADAGETQRVAIARGDAQAYAQALREQVLKPWAEYVYGDAELAPHIEVTLETSTEKTARASLLASAGAAIQALVNAGVPVDIEETATKFGIALDSNRPKATAPIYSYHLQYGIPTVNEVRATLGLKPMPDGDKPTSMPMPAGPDLAALATTPEEMAVATEATLSETPVAQDEATDGVVAARPVQGPPTYQARRAKAIEAIEYSERISSAGRKAAAEAIKPDVDMLLRDYSSATSYDDAKARILASYKNSDDTGLADALANSAIIAALAGAVSQL